MTIRDQDPDQDLARTPDAARILRALAERDAASLAMFRRDYVSPFFDVGPEDLEVLREIMQRLCCVMLTPSEDGWARARTALVALRGQSSSVALGRAAPEHAAPGGVAHERSPWAAHAAQPTPTPAAAVNALEPVNALAETASPATTPSSPALPFPEASGPRLPKPPVGATLSLELYASLTAIREAAPGDVRSFLTRHGVADPQAEDALWSAKLRADPRARAAFDELKARHDAAWKAHASGKVR